MPWTCVSLTFLSRIGHVNLTCMQACNSWWVKYKNAEQLRNSAWLSWRSRAFTRKAVDVRRWRLLLATWSKSNRKHAQQVFLTLDGTKVYPIGWVLASFSDSHTSVGTQALGHKKTREKVCCVFLKIVFTCCPWLSYKTLTVFEPRTFPYNKLCRNERLSLFSSGRASWKSVLVNIKGAKGGNQANHVSTLPTFCCPNSTQCLLTLWTKKDVFAQTQGLTRQMRCLSIINEIRTQPCKSSKGPTMHCSKGCEGTNR